MATDAYVKFGDCPDSDLPFIEGDSTDAAHYWWCELRSCGFDLTATERGAGDDDDPVQNTPTFERVTLTKRIDWASTQLFKKCYESAEASVTRSEEGNQGVGRLDRVTIHICKEAGEEKIVFLTLKYTGVRIVEYDVLINDPEPSETIVFEFERLDYEYQQTDPYTGLKVGQGQKANNLVNHQPKPGSSSQSGGAAPAITGPATGVAATGAAATAIAAGGNDDVSETAASNGANGQPGSLTDAAAVANFPGLRTGTGFGVLPD